MPKATGSEREEVRILTTREDHRMSKGFESTKG